MAVERVAIGTSRGSAFRGGAENDVHVFSFEMTARMGMQRLRENRMKLQTKCLLYLRY